MNSSELVDVALRFVEAINRLDHRRLEAPMTDDHVFVDLAGERVTGKGPMSARWKDYFDRFPGYMIHIGEIHLVGQDVALIGRTTGSHLGLPRLEESREPIIWVTNIRGNRVAEWRLYPNTERSRLALRLTEKARVSQSSGLQFTATACRPA